MWCADSAVGWLMHAGLGILSRLCAAGCSVPGEAGHARPWIMACWEIYVASMCSKPPGTYVNHFGLLQTGTLEAVGGHKHVSASRGCCQQPATRPELWVTLIAPAE